MAQREAPQFTTSDSWILLSIALASHNAPAPLDEVIGVGDAINHAIFTHAELRRGLAKLTYAGYVSARDGAYTLTEAGRRLLRDVLALSGKATVMQQWEAVNALVQAARGAPDEPNFVDPSWPYELSDEAIHTAYLIYRERMEQILPCVLSPHAALPAQSPSTPLLRRVIEWFRSG